MPRVFGTDIVETSSTTGTSTYSLNGPVVGYRGFAADFTTGDTPYYVVRNAADDKYEVNRFGTFTDAATDTLTRNVYLSSNGGAPVSWIGDDLPLVVYVPSASEVLEFVIQSFRATTRNAWLKFGWWFDQNNPASGSDTVYIYDGTSDIPMAEIDTNNHTGFFKHFPPGFMFDYGGATAPSGTLLCYGQAISRTTYAKLFDAIGTTWGSGDGSTTFNVPDIRGKVTAGKTDMGGSDAGNLTGGGVLGASLGQQSRTASGSTSGALGVTASGGTSFGSGLLNMAGGPNSVADINHTHSVTVTGATSGALTVSVSSFGIVQPTAIANKVISTGGV